MSAMTMLLGALYLQWVIFINFFSQCNCAELEMLINGTVMESTMVSSCLGDNLTYVCTVASLAHTWSVGQFVPILAVVGADVLNVGMFTWRRVDVSDGVLITSLSVIAFAELDQTVIWCADGSIGGDEIQNTTTRVAGAPILSVQQNSAMLTSFDINTFSCYTFSYVYTATPTDETGNVQNDIMISETSSSFTTTGYDVCKYKYTFTASVLMNDGSFSANQTTTKVAQNPTNFTAADLDPITGLSSTSDGLMWSAPANAMECSFQYMITLDANPLISLTIATSSVSFTDLSDSGFPTCVRQNVTFTPVVPIYEQILGSNSLAATLVILDPDLDITIPIVSATADELDIIITWDTEVEGLDFVVIQHDSGSSLLMDYDEGEYTVSLDCSFMGENLIFNVVFIPKSSASSDCEISAIVSVEIDAEECNDGGGGHNGGVSISTIILVAVIQGLISY